MHQHLAKGLRLRIERAANHEAALKDERKALLDHIDDRIVGYFEPQTSEYIFRVDGEAPRLEIGLLVGEFAHQLRSALDNVICALVRHRGGIVTTQTAFVIADTEEQWKSGQGRLKGLSDDDRTAVHELQPYRKGDQARQCRLSQLHWLSLRDKHRLLHASYWVFQEPLFPLPEKLPGMPVPTNETTGPCAAFVLNSGESHGDRAEICRCLLDAPGPNPQMRMEGDPPLDITLSDSERPLRVDDLSEIRVTTQRVVGQFIERF
jgi:hypothetical protein